MPLDKPTFVTALATAFQRGMDDPEWTKEDTAQALADAIDAFVRSAAVSGVTVQVANPGGGVIGTGTQTGTGALS
jgi:hypothetical protein